jgi:hypothetical protein
VRLHELLHHIKTSTSNAVQYLEEVVGKEWGEDIAPDHVSKFKKII